MYFKRRFSALLQKLAVAPDSLGAMELPDVTGNFKSYPLDLKIKNLVIGVHTNC